jgi:hypothetical protein
MDVFLARFECLRCRAQELHSVSYVGNIILSIRCERCGSLTGPPPRTLVSQYVKDLEQRAVRKPGRVLEEAREHPLTFPVRYLLPGLIHKPVELLRELAAVANRLRRERRPA